MSFSDVKKPCATLGAAKTGSQCIVCFCGQNDQGDIHLKAEVGYVLDAGLYAIINMQHDGACGVAPHEWITLTDSQGNVTEENNAAVKAQFIAVWGQIASRFKTIDSHLIFEGMNEIHDGDKAPAQAYHDIITSLNQTFPVVMFLHGYTGNPIASQPWIVSALNPVKPCAEDSRSLQMCKYCFNK